MLVTTKYNHPILLSRVQWSGVHVVKCECMCSSPCCLGSSSWETECSCGTKAVFSLDPSVSGSDEVASAVATCGQAMLQLRKLSMSCLNPLLLLRALRDRDCPLEYVTVMDPPWVCTALMCVDRTDDAML